MDQGKEAGLQSTVSKEDVTSGSGLKQQSSGTTYYYDNPNAVWLKQSKDAKGKEKCEGQAKQLEDYVKWLKESKGKGKKGEGKSKAKGSRGSEEPEVVVVDDGDEGSTFQRGQTTKAVKAAGRNPGSKTLLFLQCKGDDPSRSGTFRVFFCTGSTRGGKCK